MESTHTPHSFSEAEIRRMQSFEATSYWPSNSEAYKRFLAAKRDITPYDWRRWMIFAAIGVVVGFLAFIIKVGYGQIAKNKNDLVAEVLERDGKMAAWIAAIGIKGAIAAAASIVVVVISPAAAGSGVPEVIAYLNGVHVPQAFNFRTVVAKILSVIAAVGSGLPVGPEGPMISLGAAMGAAIGQGRSRTFGCSIFSVLSDSRSKRDFLSAGAAAGVSAAFGAPVGGLLFAVEELSSSWTSFLGWQVFFSSMLASFTKKLLYSTYIGAKDGDSFGVFTTDAAVLFHVDPRVNIHLFIFFPAAILGLLGGGLAIVFTYSNLKIVRFRRQYIIHSKVLRVLEVFLIMALYATASTLLPSQVSCFPQVCKAATDSHKCRYMDKQNGNPPFTKGLEKFTCRDIQVVVNGTSKYTLPAYNEVASLLLVTSEEAIDRLLSRRTPTEFEAWPLLIVLIVYAPLACWAAGSSIASGFVIPMLFVGSIYGRLVGLWMVSLFGYDPANPVQSWVDPGVVALLGAASFFAGVSRLKISLAVIILEISGGDVFMLLPLMTSITISKTIADLATHSLYHSLLEVDSMPYIDSDIHTGTIHDQFAAGHIMRSPAVCIPEIASVASVANVLLLTTHHTFPIVRHRKFRSSRMNHMFHHNQRQHQRRRANGHRFAVGVAGIDFGVLHEQFEKVVGHRTQSQRMKRRSDSDESLTHAASETGRSDEEAAEEDMPWMDNDLQDCAFVGTVSRAELEALMQNEKLIQDAAEIEMTPVVAPTSIDPEMRIVTGTRGGRFDMLTLEDATRMYTRRRGWAAEEEAIHRTLEKVSALGPDKVIDLRFAIDQSAACVPYSFSLERANMMFRTLSLRCMVVLDDEHSVVGIITRCDLMPHHVEARIAGGARLSMFNRGSPPIAVM